jgi:hypothetical protein
MAKHDPVGIVAGSFGFFCSMLMLFFKFVPSISMHEVINLTIKDRNSRVET